MWKLLLCINSIRCMTRSRSLFLSFNNLLGHLSRTYCIILFPYVARNGKQVMDKHMLIILTSLHPSNHCSSSRMHCIMDPELPWYWYIVIGGHVYQIIVFMGAINVNSVLVQQHISHVSLYFHFSK